jgi:hypothetical protein
MLCLRAGPLAQIALSRTQKTGGRSRRFDASFFVPQSVR